jgi:spermidine synthase
MNQPYSIVPIISAILFFYLLSLACVNAGIFGRKDHWHFWNTLLLISFIITGILGLLLVMQINYKWNIPRSQKILRWHVHFGIGMTILAFIHCFKHLRYYKGMFSGKPENTTAGTVSNTGGAFAIGKTKITGALIVLGITALFSQMVIIRELLNIFQGNELIIGLILCLWMLLTALGSRLGLKVQLQGNDGRLVLNLLLLEGVLPSAVVLLMYLMENRFFPPGTAKGLIPAVLFCLVLLTPCCIASGLLFTILASGLNKATGENRISQAYSWESVGSMAAGALFGLLFSFLLDSFQVLALVALVNALICIWIHQDFGRNVKWYIWPSILIVVSGILLSGKADQWIRSMHYAHQKVIYTHDTPYGNITVTSTAGQLNFFGNGNLYFSTENSLVYEEAVHFAMLQQPKAQHVLIVSGGIGGMTEQVLKYRFIRQIDYIEINPWLVKAEENLKSSRVSSKVRVITWDARRWIRNSEKSYDVILVNTPDPSNAQINRYYTLEFFQEVRRALCWNGIFSISLSPTANYVSDEAGLINSTLYQTLIKVFAHVEIITGERNYFIASDGPVRIDLADCVRSTGIHNDYVNPYNLDDNLILQNNNIIMSRIRSTKPVVNKDLMPTAYFQQIHYWLSIHQSPGWIYPIAIMLILFMFIAFGNLNPARIGVFTTGFAGASGEFLILMVFQLLFGYVYQTMGIIIGFYMLGLVVSTLIPVDPRNPKLKAWYLFVQVVLMLLILLIPGIMHMMISRTENPGWIIQAFLFLVTACVGGTAGFTFNLACHLESGSMQAASGNLYATDLAGAAGGTLLVSMMGFPVFGLQITCLIISMLIAAGVLVNLFFYRPGSLKIH